MKYIKTFESHRASKNTETVNEEFLGAIGKFFSNVFKKVKERINKTRGGNEVEAIYQKYLDLISKEFAKTAKVELNLAAAARENEGTSAVPKKESLNIKGLDMINEADDDDAPADAPPTEVDAKTAVAQLKSKKTILEQIVKKLKDMALREMDVVLKKYGGGAKNPQLDIIITAKKNQFDLDFMNAQINWLEKAGDKTESINISKQRDVIAKKIEADYKDFDSKKAIQYKEGDEVVYKLKDFKQEEWNKLSADQKSKTEEAPANKYVGVNKIDKIEGDKFTLLDKDGKPTIQKTGSEILDKPEGSEGDTEGATEYKVGDVVIYKRGDFVKKDGQKQWDAIKQEDRSNPEAEAVKKMTAEKLIGSSSIEKVDMGKKGEEISFKKADGTGTFEKSLGDILSIVKK
jgi:hypothetical protein